MEDALKSSKMIASDRTENPTKVEVRTFETLDGLRGAAAIIVMIWHIRVWQPLPSAYLAVDLFFMLSGFVIAYRYDTRLSSSLSTTKFMTMRVIRLYPLYLLGTLIGAGWALARSFVGEMNGQLSNWTINLALGLAMLPKLLSLSSVYPFNAPAWSLFYEIVVNGIYARFAKWSSDQTLGIVAALSAVSLVIMSLSKGDLHFTAMMPWFIYASVRAVFGFVLGILIFRWRIAGRLPSWSMHPVFVILLLVLLLACPGEGPIAAYLAPGIVIAGFPIVLILGINSHASPSVARLMNWLGLLSFPLYAIHDPIWSVISDSAHKMHVSQAVAAIVAIPIIFICAWIASEFFDKPVRAVLTSYTRKSATR